MDTLSSFKAEIESIFQKSFQELTQKNNLNKAILTNLMQAANDQSKRISQLDQNIQNLKRTTTPNITTIKNEINSQQKIVHDNFDSMMHRLCQIQQGVNQAKRTADTNIQINRQSQQSLNDLIKQIQKIQKQQIIPQYYGNRDQLYKQVQQFEKILDQQTQKIKQTISIIDTGKKISIQPLQTFQTKIIIHNKNNQDILKNKLKQFSQRIKKMQKKIQQATWSMNNQAIKAKNQQKKIIQDINHVQQQMQKIRNQLQYADQKRKQQIQSSALTLDNMVQEMLAQTKKLQLRVDTLKKGYQEQINKIKIK